jgi:hypothetical protein
VIEAFAVDRQALRDKALADVRENRSLSGAWRA